MSAIRLPKAPKEYDAQDQRMLRTALEQNDAQVLKRRQDVALINGERLLVNYAFGLTAHAGGGQANATAMVYGVNHFGTVATAADSGKLPPAIAGARVSVSNRGANAMQVFGNGTDTINDVSYSTGVSLPSGSTVTYVCPANGRWYV